jgi:hypothetical protein
MQFALFSLILVIVTIDPSIDQIKFGCLLAVV